MIGVGTALGAFRCSRLDGPEHDLDRRAAARRRPQAHLALDRLGAKPHVREALTRASEPSVVEADAVVADGDYPPAVSLADRHLDLTCTGVPASVAEPSCTIRKTSICSSGANLTWGSTSSSTSSAPSAVRTST